MLGANIAYGAISLAYAMRCPVLKVLSPSRTLRCPVLTSRMVLSACYALPGTDLPLSYALATRSPVLTYRMQAVDVTVLQRLLAATSFAAPPPESEREKGGGGGEHVGHHVTDAMELDRVSLIA
eukprot:2059955-Rhodomonas_salina.1